MPMDTAALLAERNVATSMPWRAPLPSFGTRGFLSFLTGAPDAEAITEADDKEDEEEEDEKVDTALDGQSIAPADFGLAASLAAAGLGAGLE